MIENERELNNNWFSHIPANWVAIPMSIAFVPRNSKVSDKDFPPLSVTKNGIMPQIEGVAKTDNNDQRKLVIAGDYVINSRSDRKGSSGLSSMDGSVSLINTVFFPRDPFELNMPYYHFLFRSYYFCEEFYRNGTGIVDDLWSTNWERMKRIKIPIPPIKDQILISTFLTNNLAHLDALIEKKQILIELLQEKRQAIIEEAVTKGLNPNVPMKDSGIEWLGNVPAHWKTMLLGIAAEKMTNGYVGPTRDILKEEGVRYLQSLHIKNGKILFDRKHYYVDAEWSKKQSKSVLRTGDVLFVQTGAEIGQCSVVTPEFDGCNCHALIIVKLRKKIGLGEYLTWYFQSNHGKNMLLSFRTGALHPHLDTGRICNIKLAFPPIDEQKSIINLLNRETEKYDQILNKIQLQIEKLQEYRQALISEAVTGKINVRHYGEETQE